MSMRMTPLEIPTIFDLTNMAYDVKREGQEERLGQFCLFSVIQHHQQQGKPYFHVLACVGRKHIWL